MKASTSYVGLDVHKATISVAIAEDGRGGDVRDYGVVENRADILIKLVERLGRRGQLLHFCYEAGSCGYGLHRLLSGLGHDCTVVAPSLIPKKAGDLTTSIHGAGLSGPRVSPGAGFPRPFRPPSVTPRAGLDAPATSHDAGRGMPALRGDGLMRFGRCRL